MDATVRKVIGEAEEFGDPAEYDVGDPPHRVLIAITSGQSGASWLMRLMSEQPITHERIAEFLERTEQLDIGGADNYEIVSPNIQSVNMDEA